MLQRKSFSPAEFGKRHNLSRSTVFKELSSGNLRSYKVGNCRRITEEAERDWIMSREGEA